MADGFSARRSFGSKKASATFVRSGVEAFPIAPRSCRAPFCSRERFVGILRFCEVVLRGTMKLRSWWILLAAIVAAAVPLAVYAADWRGAAQAPVPGLTRAPPVKSDTRF